MWDKARLPAFAVLVIFLGTWFFRYARVDPAVEIPGHAPMYLDDAEQSYIAPPCLVNEHRPRGQLNRVRLADFWEATAKGYDPDKLCKSMGMFNPRGQSVMDTVLVELGLRRPMRHWWEAP